MNGFVKIVVLTVASSCVVASILSSTVAIAKAKIELLPYPFQPAPFSAAADVNGVLWLSGMIGTDRTNHLVPGGMKGEARQIMSNIRDLLGSRGLSFDDVFKCTVMMADISQWGDFNTIYVSYFKPGHLPARSAFGANGLSRGAHIEVECWALDRVK